MQCSNCREELPSDTPVCPRCGPTSFGAGPRFSPPPPPVVTPVFEGLAAAVPSAAPPPLPTFQAPAAVPDSAMAVAVEPPARPAPRPAEPGGPPRLSKKEKKARRKARMQPADRDKVNRAAHTLQQISGGGTVGEARHAQRAPFDQILSLLPGFGREVVPDTSEPPRAFSLPRSIRILAWLDIAMGLFALARAAGWQSGRVVFLGGGDPTVAVAGSAILGLACLAAGAGLFALQPLGRQAQLALCVTSLVYGGFWLPVAFLVFLYLQRPGVKLLLSGLRPPEMTPEQRGHVNADVPAPVLMPVVAVLQGFALVWQLLQLLSGVIS